MRSSTSLPTRCATSSTSSFSTRPCGPCVPWSCPPCPASITMRPTLSPNARVSELPPVEVRLAPLLNSPGNGAGGADAASPAGSVLRAAGWAGRGSAGELTGSASGVALVLGEGEVARLFGSGSDCVLSTGLAGQSSTKAGFPAPGGLTAGATGGGSSALIGVGGFGAGSAGSGGLGMGMVGSRGPCPGRISMIRRYGLESCDVLISTAPVKSTTTRVVPGLVSATRTRCTNLSLIWLNQIRQTSIRGRAFRISKYTRSGLCRRSVRNLKSPDTSMAMRVTSDSDQLRMAVTVCREARSLCANNTVTEIASAAKGFITSRLSRNVTHGTVRLDYFHDVSGTSFPGVDSLRRRGRHDGFGGRGLFGLLQLPPHLQYVIPGFGKRRHSAVACDRGFAGIVSGQRQRVIFAVKIEQIAQIFGAALNILDGVEDIADAEAARSSRDQLHQSQRPFIRNRVRIIVAFHFDYGMDQLW